MNADEAYRAVAEGARVVGQMGDDLHPPLIGVVLAYSIVPMVLLEDDDGGRHWRRQDHLTLVAPPEPLRWEGDDS